MAQGHREFGFRHNHAPLAFHRHKIIHIVTMTPAQCRHLIKLNKLFKDYDNTRGKDFGYLDKRRKGIRK